jgi:ABC-type phosphate/phosphonate transport system permease subunit
MNSDLNWSNQRRTRVTLALFAVIVAAAIVAAFATTLHRVDTRQASSDAPPGTIGLAHPHPPLDKSPGNPVK